MTSLDDAVIARLKTHGHTFEIFVDPDKALEYRSGVNIPLDEILAAESVFKDAASGEKASEEVMKEVFGDAQLNTAVTKILKKGELHLTTQQKARILEERRKKIINIIARNSINPQTKLPHPPSRIEKAMEEAKVKVDAAKSAEEQIEKILKELKPIIPIKFETTEVAIKIPANYAGKLYHVLKEFGEVRQEQWVSGEQYCKIEIPAGIRDEMFEKLNNATHGEIKIKILK
ncbi:MAG: ribosome assembly factor SBDS [Candidatus Altiarchaeota archaeon]